MRAQLTDWIVTELLQAKARWIQHCLKAILPRELYVLAAQDQQLGRVRAWCKANGFEWFDGKLKDGNGECQLRKNGIIVAVFRPQLVKADTEVGKQVAFIATVFDQPVKVTS